MNDQSWFKTDRARVDASGPVKALVVNLTDEPPHVWPVRRAWNAYLDASRFKSGSLPAGTPVSLIGEVLLGGDTSKFYGPARMGPFLWLSAPVVIP